MKKLVRLMLTLTLFFFLTGAANAVPVAKFGKYLSNENMDIWLLSLLCDSDLSVVLTSDDFISFLYGGIAPGGKGTFFSGNMGGANNPTGTFSGKVPKGNYFVQVNQGNGNSPAPLGMDPEDETPFEGLPQEGDHFFDQGGTGTLIEINVSPVPEPATLLLLGIGLLAIGRTARRMKS